MNLKLKKLSSKLIIPITTSIFLLSLILVSTIWFFQMRYKNYVIKKDIASFEKRIDYNIENISAQGLYIASIMASMDTIKSIYRAYYTGADFNEATSAMDVPVHNVLKTVEANLGVTPKIHFHVAPARSFYRSWTDMRGDDIGSFRSSVKDVLNTGKPVHGIEIGRGGFVVRGIVPIIDNGTILGSVECFFSMKEVMQYSKLSNLEEIAIFMNTRLLDVATEFASSTNINKNNKIVGRLIEFDKTSDKFNTKAIPVDTLNLALENKISFEKGNYAYVLTPIINYKGEHQGVSAIQIDNSGTNTAFWQLTNSIIVIAAITLLLMAILVSYLIRKIVSKRIDKVNVALENMSNGLLTKEIPVTSVDEVGNMEKSLNRLISRNKETALFANAIGSGNFDSQFKSLSNDDLIGNALLEMRSSLMGIREEEEKRRDEEKKQQWQTNGIATFSELLRDFDDNLEEFAFKIISNLVKYLDANQGGLFIVNDDNKHDIYLELKATVAYDRRKFMQKRIGIGEGIIGACFFERESMYLTDIPESYIEITSGLGKSTPRAIFIAPLKVNDQIYGMIEIASLKEILDYQREFVEKICESIASALATTHVNQQTKKLLEASKIQETQLAEQEEEMRQNMEELMATQEESLRRESQLKKELQEARETIEKLKSGNK